MHTASYHLNVEQIDFPIASWADFEQPALCTDACVRVCFRFLKYGMVAWAPTSQTLPRLNIQFEFINGKSVRPECIYCQNFSYTYWFPSTQHAERDWRKVSERKRQMAWKKIEKHQQQQQQWQQYSKKWLWHPENWLQQSNNKLIRTKYEVDYGECECACVPNLLKRASANRFSSWIMAAIFAFGIDSMVRH